MGKKKSKAKAKQQQQQQEEEQQEENTADDSRDKSSSKDDGKIRGGESSSSKDRSAKKVKITTTTATKPVDDGGGGGGGRVEPSLDAISKGKDGKKAKNSTVTTATADTDEEQQADDEMKTRPSTTKASAPKTTTTTTKSTTKRQRLRQVNEKNRWTMPSPRIQTVEGRAKASIRIAGLSANQKQLHAKNSSLVPTLDLHSPEVKFGRLLGSVDERVRHQAVVQLKNYLKARCAIVEDNNNNINNEKKRGLSEMDLLKLWKALWYTLYMADKVPVQEALSETIASLLWCVAGTEDEDEYTAQAYMPFDDDDDDEDEEKEGEDEQYDDDDDPDFTCEELVNTMRDNKENSSDSSCNDDEDEDVEMDNNYCARMEYNQGECDNSEDDEDDSEIMHCRGVELASLFIRTFFQTIRREWGRMDKYRVDKFYTLVRLVMHEVFVYMAKRHWNAGIISLFNDAIYEQVLRETPNGLRYHVIDVTLPELAKVNANSKHCPMPLTEATLFEVLMPYFAMAQTGAGGDDSVQARVMENILIKFLTQYSIARTETPRDEEEEEENNSSSQNDKNEKASNSLVMDNVHVGTIGQFIFDAASDPDTLDKYRKSLYDLHKRYARRLQEPGVKDVNIQVDNDEEEIDEEEEHESSSGEKKANHDDMEAVETTTEVRYDGDVDTPERPARNTIKKKKKKFKEAGATLVADEKKVAEEEEPVVLGKKKKSSKRSIEKVGNSNDLDDDAADEGAEADNDTAEEDAVKEKKKRKKKKLKKNDRREADTGVEEEEVTISLQDQAKAKASLLAASKREQERAAVAAQQQEKKQQHQSKDKKKKSRKDREQDAAAAAEAAARQVKFAPVNHARSWSASMKGLRTMTPKLQPSPEKGLLRKSLTKKQTKAANRKKATDYF